VSVRSRPGAPTTKAATFDGRAQRSAEAHLPARADKVIWRFSATSDKLAGAEHSVSGERTTVSQCKNCGYIVSEVYCSHCGQRIAVGRISAAYVLQEFFHFLTNIRRLFFLTSLRLLLSPGAVAEEFVEGKRQKYQSPVSYFLIWITIYILLISLADLSSGVNKAINFGQYFGPGKSTTYAISHLGVVLTAVVPVQTLYLYLLIAKKKFTYFETMAAVIYLIGTIILLQSAFVFCVWLIHFAGVGAVNIASSDALKVVYLAWFAADFSKRFSLQLGALRVVLFVGLAIGTFSVWRLYGVPALFQEIHFGGD
jgi:hypothetical protein